MKQFNRPTFFALGLLILIMGMSGGVALAEDPIFVPVKPPENPLVIIAADRWMPVFQAGETADLNIPIQNRSNTPATQVRVSVDIGDIKTAPFEIDKMLLTRHVGYLTGTMVVGFKVKVPANAKPQLYPLNVTVSWSSEEGVSGSESATIYVKIENSLKQPLVKLQTVNFKGDRLPAGQASPIALVMFNDSDLAIKDLELKLSGFSPNGLNLKSGSDTQFVQNMPPHETKPIEYLLFIDPKMESGTYTLDLAVKYQDQQNTEYTKEFKVYVPVDGKGSQDDLTPRIIIDNYSLDSEYARAGQAFTLVLSLLNTSSSKAIKNLKVSLSSEGGVFSPVGCSNSFYIADLPPQGRMDQTLVLKPKTGAENGTHSITATLDYQDEKGTKFTETEIISIPVAQPLQLTTSEVVIPEQIFAGNPTAISLDFYNTGRAMIRNLMITTQGDFEVQNGDVFVGNLEAGKDDYYDVTVIAPQEGKFKGVIALEYDDDTDAHYKIEKPFTLTVLPPQEMPPEPGMENPQVKDGKFKKRMIPAAGVPVLLLVLWLFIRRRRKKQQEVSFDE